MKRKKNDFFSKIGEWKRRNYEKWKKQRVGDAFIWWIRRERDRVGEKDRLKETRTKQE